MKKILAILFSMIIILGSLSIILKYEKITINAIEDIWGIDEFSMDMDLSIISDASFLGESQDDYSGHSVSIVGDLNGDGYDDIVIGTDWRKEVYVILGNFTGWTKDTNLSTADASFIGSDLYGQTVSGAGDVNNDGYDDFLIGARFSHDGGTNAGQTYLILGKKTNWKMKTDISNADASFLGEGQNHYSGSSVSGAGDVNGDGFDDFLIGSNGANKAYLIFGKTTGWKMDSYLSNADASFMGEVSGDGAGKSVAGGGDVNGDGFDDILIGATSVNIVYLILGKTTGWKMDSYLSNADASFLGEYNGDSTGGSLSNCGDVNGDGYDDILIGADGNTEGGQFSGQTYLVFGNSSGWKIDSDLANSDASFIGAVEDEAGNCVSIAGDVNGDGFDDIIIGASHSIEGDWWAGQTYLILGKSDDWSLDMNLSNVDASFLGEGKWDCSGGSLSSSGDVNGDGLDDILIGALQNDESYTYAGQTYLIFGKGHTEPLEVYSVTAVPNEVEIGDFIYIEINGLDGNDTTQDKATIFITSSSIPFKFPILLEETGINTGKYVKTIKISIESDIKNDIIKATIGDIINFSAMKDPSKFDLVKITAPLILKTMEYNSSCIEDNEYRIHCWNDGYNSVTEWKINTDGQWLSWDEENHDIYGTPNNGDVGSCWVRISITDGLGYSEEHDITIDITNYPPDITEMIDIHIMEDEYYEFELNSDDEGLGNTKWFIEPSLTWLKLDSKSGVLSGTPTNTHVGSYDIFIWIDDGNGGTNSTEFTIRVIDVNDPPIITTEPRTSVEQEGMYYVQFNAIDEDDINTYEWSLNTDANFLEINKNTGVLSGTPENDDVGIHFVNVSAKDIRGELGWLNFTLEVIDVNDPPSWVTVPSDSQIDQGKLYTFTVEAIDVDRDDSVSYSISSQPGSDISIDENTGEISWIGSLERLIPNPNFVLNVEVSTTDGEEMITHGFTLTVNPNPSPTSTLFGPEDGERVTSEGILLEWEGEDDGEEPLKYDIYMGDSHTSVSMIERSMLWEEDVMGTSIHTGEVERGKTYYWMVIPKDLYSSGICTNDVFSFSVNILPSIQEFVVPEAEIGIEYRLTLMGSDLNSDDLEFSVIEGPAGMEIYNGMITWMPALSQVGTHTVNISLTDGYETIYTEFDVTVPEEEIIDTPDEKGSPIVLIIIIIVIILILAGAGVGLFLYMKNRGKEGPNEEPTDENPPEDTGPPEEDKQAYNQLYSEN